MLRTGLESTLEARDESHWLNGLSMPENLRLMLAQSGVEQVEIDRKRGSWIVHLASPKPFDLEALHRIGTQWKQAIPSLKQVEWKFAGLAAEGKVSFSTLVEQWAAHTTQIETEIPSLKGWLDSSTIWSEKEHCLTIELKNQVAQQWIESKGIKAGLVDWFARNLGWRPEINWSVRQTDTLEIAESTSQDLYLLPEYTPEEPIGFGAEIDSLMPFKAKGHSGSAIWYGRAIKSPTTQLVHLVEEERTVTVAGKIFDLEVRELRSGRTLVVFNITDNTDSITVKLFVDKKEPSPVLRFLENGKWALVRGSAQVDRYSQELTLLAQDINAGVAPERMDDADEKRVELHLHTKMSMMDGLVEVKDLMQCLAKWGHSAVAITDHGVVQAFPEAYAAAEKNGIKLICGVEGYLINEDDVGTGNKTKRARSYHILILAQNPTGLFNLYQLISGAHIECFYRHPRLRREEMMRLREGLILGTACEAGELIQAYLQGKSTQELEEIASFYDFIEIQPVSNNEFLIRNGKVPDVAALQEMNRRLYDIADRMGKPVIATGDVHILHPEDDCFRRILQASKGFEDAENQSPLYLRTTTEMLTEFAYLGEERARKAVITNPQQLANSIEKMRPVPQELHAPVIEGAEEQIADLAYQKVRELYGESLPDLVQARLDKELNAIISNGFAVLYLVAHKLVKKSNADGYLVGSRGSVGSSFVATLTGITEVNPLPAHYLCPNCQNSEFEHATTVSSGADLPDKNCPCCQTPYLKEGHEIPFETFLGFNGDKVPDIDLNFSGDYQSQAHRYVEDLFGRDHVFRAGTIATIAERTAFGFVKKYLKEKDKLAREAEISRLVKGCSGVKRTTGQHPGGLIVLPQGNNIHEFTPVQRPAQDMDSKVITTHFDYHAISERLVKLDILGHDDPTVIRMLHDLTGFDPRQVQLDEPKTMQLFSSVAPLGVTPEQIRSRVGTYGIPEFGTRFVRQMLEDTHPRTFSDLVRISGFSHGTDVWLNNAQDLIKSGQVQLSEAISTRDDIMTYLIQQELDSSLAFRIMEDVRKGKGLTADFEQAMQAQSIPSWYINSCNSIKYMFPKAHAVAYVMMAFRIAYFKVYYPEAFYASFFTVRADEFDAQLIVGGTEKVWKEIEEIEQKGNEATAKEKSLLTILEVALELYERGLKLRPVHLMESHAYRFIITPQGLLPPFAALQGLGKAAAASIVECRNARSFTSVEDLHNRAKVSKNILDVLKEHGSLQGLPESDQLSLF